MNIEKIVTSAVGEKLEFRFFLKHIPKNYKSCDVYISRHNFVFLCDSYIFNCSTNHSLDVKDVRGLEVFYNSFSGEFSCKIPYLREEKINTSQSDYKSANIGDFLGNTKEFPNITQLLRITDCCIFFNNEKIDKFTKNFSYGFCYHYKDDTSLVEDDLKHISKISNPTQMSLLQRWQKREKDENDEFSKDHYKLNFVELEVPDDLENPLKFVFNYDDNKLTTDEKNVLNKINAKKLMKTESDQITADCGLVELLLCVCYDIRCTQNETTCESAWTISVLSAMLSYFESQNSLKRIVKTFLRRTLIYPLYRNYDLSRLCVQDTIIALQKDKNWIIKQLINIYYLFQKSVDSRQLFNNYFIEDYIRYVSDDTLKTEHLNIISKNLKNVLMDITKKDLGLDLNEIESELLSELIDDIHTADTDDSDNESEQDRNVDEASEELDE